MVRDLINLKQLPVATVVELVWLPHMPSGYQSLIALGRPWSVDGFLIAMRVDCAVKRGFQYPFANTLRCAVVLDDPP